jgi:RecA-family ATPase
MAPLRGLLVIYGEKKTGKSFWALDLSLHIARGLRYRGHRVQQRSVVYIAAEGGGGFAKRIEAYRRKHGGQGADFYLIDARPSLIHDHAELVACISAQIGDAQPGLVVLDTLNRTLVGSESHDKDMAEYLRAEAGIEDAFGCCVALVHHCGLVGGRPRGHTSLSAAADVQHHPRRCRQCHRLH